MQFSWPLNIKELHLKPLSNPVKQAHLCGTEPGEDGQIHSIVKIWDQVLGRGQQEKNA